jgi:hypothetical protein
VLAEGNMTAKPKTIRDLKVGDTVFVVWQCRRGQPEERTSTETIRKVGRKYAYIERYRREEAFFRDTGESWDGDSRTRINGYGFDVYPCEADYRRKQFELAEKARLSSRLTDRWGRLVDLHPSIVDKLNDILDSEGLD